MKSIEWQLRRVFAVMAYSPLEKPELKGIFGTLSGAENFATSLKNTEDYDLISKVVIEEYVINIPIK